jgi:hypothetical protein
MTPGNHLDSMKMPYRITIPLLFFALAVFNPYNGHGIARAAEKPRTGLQQKNNDGKIVIKYVSFPDIFKKYEVYPWETLKLEEFRKVYAAMLDSKKYEAWTRSLTGTGNQNKMLHVFGEHLVLVTSCKPHFCDTSQVLILFKPADRKCFAVYAEDGRFDYLGSPDNNMRNLLKILLVEEYGDTYKAQ